MPALQALLAKPCDSQNAKCKMQNAKTAVVIDTNTVLDLWGFSDPKLATVREALEAGETWFWIATPWMRDELRDVLTRSHLQRAFALRGSSWQAVAHAFDAHVCTVAAPDPLPMAQRVHCTDPNDQPFLNLALAHGAQLWSKDRAVLKCRKRLALRGVQCLQLPT